MLAKMKSSSHKFYTAAAASSSSSSSASASASCIRQFGQRSLSSLLSTHQERKPNKSENSSVSLMEFLDKKLEQRSQKTLQVKEFDKPSNVGPNPIPKILGGGKPTCEKKSSIPASFFQKPKSCPSTMASQDFFDPVSDLASLKRKRFADNENSWSSSSRLLVLGDEPKLKRKFSVQNCHTKTPLFNHYADGGGWWDTDMIGLASDEIGSTEMWEGVGSTTIAGP